MRCPSGYDKVLNEAKGSKVWGTCVSSVDPDQGLTYAYYLREDDKWIVTTNASIATTSTRYKHPAYRTVIGFTRVPGFNTAPVSSTSLPGADFGSGLKTSAKAGIEVGVSLGVTVLLALFGFVYFLGRKKRKGSSEQTVAEDSGKSTEWHASEPCELDGKDDRPPTRQELQSKSDTPELEGNQGGLTQELEGVNDWPPIEFEATNPADKGMERTTGGINSTTSE
ncbi:hypothetical protein N7509_000766 [Penicillium cosmopolitanum]|uniref:Uncharacterized protein n=1 Tax=Penicillium cosmopolitanum TaxID=1131564 RepID=A0A9X0BEI8_9EURO|nr:uncharacterized protein N7509_000766 [Penicillium cosmopolitanum]KAJ5414139.1 hypothetical protein N7509_000766 [Penicillium cosmopolitanum]